MRVVTIIDLLPITIIDGSGRLHTGGIPVVSSLCSGLSFRSLFSLGGGTGNAPMISLRLPLITEHHFVSNLNDLARDVAPRFTKPSLGISDWKEPKAGQ
jgi:hypothetical protein